MAGCSDPEFVLSENQVKPDVKTLCNELVSVSDWRKLGLYLGVQDYELDKIERSYPSEDCDGWKQKIFSLWLRHTPSSSWRDVVRALLQMGENTLAETIKQKYIGGPANVPTSPNSSHSPAVHTSPTDTAVSPTEKISGAAAFAFQNLETIKHRFANFQTKVCSKLSKNGVDIHQFVQYAKSLFHPGDFIPLSPTSLTEIFDSITDHGLWDYYHCSPLLRVVRTFGAADPEIEVWVQSYMKDLKSYRSVKKIEAFIEPGNDEVDTCTEPPPAKRTKYDPRYCCQMEWKTKFCTDHTLEYLTDVWEMFSLCYLDPDSPQTALLDQIREGCVSVMWLIPSYLVPQLIKRVKVDTKFFQKHGILKVTVGDQCIYEEEKSKENAPNKSSNSDGEDGADHSSGTSPHATHRSEDIPHAYKHGYECNIIDPPAWAPTNCPICLQVLRNPRQTDCGHIFCEVCIRQVQASQKQTCPECNQPVDSTFQDKHFQRQLNDLQVQCTNQNEEGVCDWTGELRELDNHLNLNPTAPDQLLTGCMFVSLQCEFSYVGCEAEMSRKDMAIHMKKKQSYHIQLLTDEVKKQDRKIKEQIRQIEKLTAKLQRKEEETTCTIQQMQQEFTLQLQNKDEKITHLMQQKQYTKSTPKLHQVNFCFTLDKFKRRKKKDEEWYSEPFHTHPRGYRMCVRIDANGFESSKFVSLYTCIMRGEYDDELSWPFHGKVTVELLNQKKDSHHHAYTLSYNAESMGADYCDYADRVLIGEMNHGWGNSEFISHLELSEKSSSTQYLKGDCLKFRVREVLLYN